jgi:uncharacterized membrane protein
MVPASPMGMATFRCPSCGYAGHAMITERVSTGGWIVFAVLLLVCFPIFWIPLITMKERKAQCPNCRLMV